jgi:Flp pilus assembly protein TadD
MARQVENAIDAGDGDLQARALRQRIAANPGDLDARLALASIYQKRGVPELAVEHYRMAASQFPDSPMITLEMAKTLRQMGEDAAAMKAIEDFITHRPAGSWELFSLQGILDDEMGRFKAAETAHRAALALDPGRSALHNNLGYNLILQGHSALAAAEFRRAIELDPRSQIAHNNLGTALAAEAHQGPGEALAEWQKSSDPAIAHNNLAAVLIEQGHYPEAREELQTALGFRRDFPAAMANLKLVAELDGRPPTVPIHRDPVNLWKRVALTFSKVVTGTPAPKPSSPDTEGPEAAKK